MKKFFQWIGVVALSVIAGISYRFGGSEGGQRWVREVGVGIAVIGCLTILFGWNWFGLLIMGTVWIETTYFKAKGSDAKWWNWLLVGLSYSIVPLPYVIASHGHWVGFGIRAVVVTAFTTIWRTFIGNAVVQEIGAGAIQVISIPLLLIG